MLDDNRDKEMQRNQLVAIILMVAVALAWITFFTPTPQPKTAQRGPARENAAGQQAPAPGSPDKAAPADSESPVAWLPPPADAPASSGDDEISLKNDGVELVFTRVGARLKQARVILGRDGENSAQLVPDQGGVPDAEADYPLGLLFPAQFWGDALNSRRWDASLQPDGRTVVFSLEASGRARISKTFELSETGHVLRTRVAVENKSNGAQVFGMDTREPAFSLTWSPQVASGDLTKGAYQQFVWRKDGDNTYTPTSGLKPPAAGEYSERVPAPEWVAVWSAYFAVGMRAEFEGPTGWISGAPQRFAMGLGAPRTEVAPGQSASWDYQVYIGPTSRRDLGAAWEGFGTVQRFFTSVDFMDTFAKWLLAILNWFHDHTIANYGVAIILLTVLVRVAVFPLTWKSMISMKRMSMLAPEMEKIKQEVGDDQQELQRRTMELYRERGINPLNGCFPILLQMPVFFALYRMLWSAVELRRAPFLWMTDLSEPDRLISLPFAIPIPFTSTPLDAINLLPILGAVAMLASQKIMPPSGPAQNPQQKMMLTIMPVIFSVFMYNLASGLNLYIFVSTLLGIAQSFVIQRANINIEPTKKKKPASRPRHFYDAAQAKKREMAREIRRDKERRRKPGRDD